MKRNYPIVCLLATAVMAGIFMVSDRVEAGHRAGTIMLSPMVGGYIFDSDLDIDDATALGGFAGYNLTDRIGLEGAYFDAESQIDGSSVDVDLDLWTINGLYHFMPEEQLVPYVSLGLGMARFDADSGNDHDEMAASIGAGVKYFLAEDVAFRADIREVSTFPENSLLYSVGVTFYLGGKTAAAPSPAAAVAEKIGPKDSDGDGVIDTVDQCPGTPRGADVDNRGCWVIKNLNFDTSRDEIKPVYYGTLNNVVDVLKQNPGLRVEIQGHTDSMGDRAFNEDLSQRRAQSVVNYLVGQGIDVQRLTAKGYGPAKPVATNDTPQGRAQNRRVEINPLD